MANPLISQGVLNRLKASVIYTGFPQLNVTPSFLGSDGISLALTGDATTFINTMTGAVPSPEPYQPVTITINLLKTQFLADLYKAQQELTTLLGEAIVRPDVSEGLSPYPLFNCAIMGVRELNFAGRDAGYVVTVGGFYYLNQALWL